MNFNISFFFKSSSIILGSFVDLTAIASIAEATPTSIYNPSLNLNDKASHNGLQIVQQEYLPNVTFQLNKSLAVIPVLTQVQLTQAPSTEEQTVITTIPLTDNQVNIQLLNTTNTPITYQVIGHTQPRTVDRKQEIMLKDLPVPVSIMLLRPDSGLIKVIPVKKSESGILGLTLHEAMGLNDSQNTVRIKSNGEVVAY